MQVISVVNASLMLQGSGQNDSKPCNLNLPSSPPPTVRVHAVDMFRPLWTKLRLQEKTNFIHYHNYSLPAYILICTYHPTYFLPVLIDDLYQFTSLNISYFLLSTVEPLLTTTPDRRPPAYYGHSPWVQNASPFITMLQKPLIYGHLSTPYSGHFSWPQTMHINAL